MLVWILAILAAEPGWKAEGGRDGVTLESRPVQGSNYYEYRAQTETSDEVDSLCDGVFEWASVSKDHPEVKTRTVLEDGHDLRIVHDQLEPPIVSHRDLTFSITREHRQDGTCTIEYHAQNDRAPKTAPGSVRIENMRGFWVFEPHSGKTHVTYTLFAEPGGSVPPLFVHGAQREAVIDTLKRGLAKAGRTPEK
jgi:hypothetical protein